MRRHSSNGSGDTDGGRPGRRGQTTIDFAIGVSVFLAVLIFIFLFIPGILSPFTASAQDETVASNRVADNLATGMLAEPTDPYVLDSYCTVEFFRETSPSRCAFSGGTLEEQLGVDTSRQNLNITIRRNDPTGGTERVGWNTDDPDTGLVSVGDDCDSDDDCDVSFDRGDPVPTNQPSVTSVRVVSLDGTDVTLYVEMW